MSTDNEVYKIGDITVHEVRNSYDQSFMYLRVKINGKYLGDTCTSSKNYKSIVKTMIKAHIKTRENRLDTLRNEFFLREKELHGFKHHLEQLLEV